MKGGCYRGMGSLEAMTKDSDVRYLGDKSKMKVAQGVVVGAVADYGSVLKFIPYTMQAIKQVFQNLGAKSLQSTHDLLRPDVLRMEVVTRLLFFLSFFFLGAYVFFFFFLRMVAVVLEDGENCFILQIGTC